MADDDVRAPTADEIAVSIASSLGELEGPADGKIEGEQALQPANDETPSHDATIADYADGEPPASSLSAPQAAEITDTAIDTAVSTVATENVMETAAEADAASMSKSAAPASEETTAAASEGPELLGQAAAEAAQTAGHPALMYPQD